MEQNAQTAWIEELAREIFGGQPKPAFSIVLEPDSDDAGWYEADDEQRSEVISSILSILTTHGIAILFGADFHPQEQEQISLLNSYLKCIGYRAIFQCNVEDERVIGIRVSWAPTAVDPESAPAPASAPQRVRVRVFVLPTMPEQRF